ncbi:MAG: DNA gyrase inhibitor YacG [Phycisphaeraceae bacterium]
MVSQANHTQDKPTRCPTCREPVSEQSSYFPFCSERCKLVDLGKWLNGKYVISRPIEQSDLDEGE